MARGRFITFEGGEGAGKSTQIRRLARALRKRGLDVVCTREPGGSPSAEAIRKLLLSHRHAWQPLSEALLHYAARCEHLSETIRPALAEGRWVLSDRFADSTRVYQGVAQGLDRDVIAALDAMVVADTQPDLTLVLDVPPEVGLGRIAGRTGGGDRYERMDADVHARLRQGYLEMARAAPERCVVIDAGRDGDSVHRDVVAAVAERMGGFTP